MKMRTACLLLVSLMACAAGAAAPAPRARALPDGRIVTNLREAGTGGWLVIGDRTENTLQTLPTPYPMALERFSDPPFSAEETIPVTLSDASSLKLTEYASRDDIGRIEVTHPALYCVQAAEAWVRLNEAAASPVAGHGSVYLLAGQAGDQIRFRSKAWTPRVLRLEYAGQEEPRPPFPLQATTATEWDYQGVLRLLAGEVNTLKFAICRRRNEPLQPSRYSLVIETPVAFGTVAAYGRGDKMHPLRAYPVSTSALPDGAQRHVVSLEPFLTAFLDFLKRNPGYPQTDYIGWASVFVTFSVAADAPAQWPPVRWSLQEDGQPAEMHELSVETVALKVNPKLPESFRVHMSAGALSSIDAPEVWRGWGRVLQRCGITGPVTSDLQAAQHLRSLGMQPIFFGSYNNGFGGVNVRGESGRICPQKHLLDGGKYFGERFFEQGEAMREAFAGYELDFEPKGAGPPLACFCEDCRKVFQAQSGLQVAGMSPGDILRAHREPWIAFRNWQYAEIFRLYREASRRIDPSYLICLDAGGGAITTEAELAHLREQDGWRLEDIASQVDLYSPYFYTNTEKFIPSFRLHQRIFTRGRLAPWTATSYGVGSQSHTLSPEALRQQLFIWMASGAPVFRIWNENETGMDGLRLLTLQRTLEELAACEEAYVRGEADDEAVALSGHEIAHGPADSTLHSGYRAWPEVIQHRAHRVGDTVVATVFNLDPDDEALEATARVGLPTPKAQRYRVSDVLTGEKLSAQPLSRAEVAGGFPVRLGPREVRVLSFSPVAR